MAYQDPTSFQEDLDHASHQEAAKRHDEAARHHRDAARLLASGNRQAAVHEAHVAHTLALRAVDHSVGAAMGAGRSQEAEAP